LAIHVCVKIEFGNVVGWGSLKPNSLPYTTAGRIKDVTRSQGLLSNGDNIVSIVSGIMYENKSVYKVRYASRLLVIPGYSQLILLIKLQVLSHIQGEAEVSATVEACLLAIDKDCGFIVYSSKIELYLLTLPRRRYFKGC
jgi:hypothetical protein